MPAQLVAFIAGVVLCSLMPSPGPVWLTLVFAGLALFSWQGGAQLARTTGALLLGTAVGLCAAQSLLAKRLPVGCERTPAWIEGRVAGLPHVFLQPEGRQWQRFEFVRDTAGTGPCAGPRRLLLTDSSGRTLQPGEHWRFLVRLRTPWGMQNPGGTNRQRGYAEAGIDAVGSVSSSAPAQRLGEHNGRERHHRVRQQISEQIRSALGSGPEAALVRALAVADRNGLTTPLWRVFQQFGVSHLLVISGLHVGMVAACGLLLGAALCRVLALFGMHRNTGALPPLLALLLATLYTALAGFTLATSRAWLMFAALLFAAMIGRPALSWRNLLLAATVLLALNPLAVLGAGFWLSFTAVGCLLWFGAWHSGRSRWLGAHGFMALVMLPLSGVWFGGTSLIAALSNALLVPLVGMIVVPLVLAGSVAALMGSGLATPLWALGAWPLARLLPLAETLAQQYPQAIFRDVVTTPLALGLSVVALLLLCMPLRWLHRTLLFALVLPLLLPFASHRVASPQAVHVLVLDVGQGTSVLVYDRQHALLYDTGGGAPGGVPVAERAVIPVLRQRGISRLDTLIVSHGDRDHSAGIESLRPWWVSGALWAGPDLADAVGAQVCRAGAAWRWGDDVRFQLLSPAEGEQLNKNDGSCVLRIQLPGIELLLPGDIGAERERTLVRYWRSSLASDIALAAHHGSHTSSSWAWLRQVAPAYVVFTHARANHFGHPARVVVDRHSVAGITTVSTAESGALEWVLHPAKAPVLLQHRALEPRYWKR